MTHPFVFFEHPPLLTTLHFPQSNPPKFSASSSSTTRVFTHLSTLLTQVTPLLTCSLSTTLLISLSLFPFLCYRLPPSLPPFLSTILSPLQQQPLLSLHTFTQVIRGSSMHTSKILNSRFACFILIMFAYLNHQYMEALAFSRRCAQLN